MKSIQYHPLTEDILHIDLYGVQMDAKVNVKVPLVLIGQSIGVKEGGVLNQNMTEIEVACLPANIPQDIEVDISNLNLGETLRIENINLSDDLDLLGEETMLIASVVAPAKQDEPEDSSEESSEADDNTESASEESNTSEEGGSE